MVSFLETSLKSWDKALAEKIFSQNDEEEVLRRWLTVHPPRGLDLDNEDEFQAWMEKLPRRKKKIARYQQYFAVHSIMERIRSGEVDGVRPGGVVWHTQGSGKSLTMVMLAKCLAPFVGDLAVRASNETRSNGQSSLWPEVDGLTQAMIRCDPNNAWAYHYRAIAYDWGKNFRMAHCSE